MFSYSYLPSALLLLPLLSGTASVSFAMVQKVGPKRYLAPHEQRALDALENVNRDYNGFMKVFAKNAYCELTFGKDPDDVTVKSGSCRDVFSNYGNMEQYKIRWYPLTNTDPKHPERGELAVMYGNYGLTKTGCEGLFFGTTELKFNVNGQVRELRSHSTEFLNFMKCIDGNKRARIEQEEVYLAPHEQRVYDAIDNIHENYDAFKSLLADNAQCEIVSGQAPADISITSGSCKDVTRNWEKGIVHNKVKWLPVTNSHSKYPHKGVLAMNFWQYALAENGCEGLISGTTTMTFNKNGLINRIKSYVSEDIEFMDCIDNNALTEPKI